MRFLSIVRFLCLFYLNKLPIRRFPLLLVKIYQNNSNARVESFTPLKFTIKTTENKKQSYENNKLFIFVTTS